MQWLVGVGLVAFVFMGCGGGDGGGDGDADEDAGVREPLYDGPLVRQVTVRTLVDNQASTVAVFGVDAASVTNAIPVANPITVDLSLPLLASRLLELGCADGSFSPIPDDATADDIADCSPPDLSACSAVCVGIGIVDIDRNGVADATRLRDYGTDEAGFQLACDGVNVPIGRIMEPYNPQGSRGLGVVGPRLTFGVPHIRTGASCELSIRDEVIDVDGSRVCAPEGGDITAACEPPGAPITFASLPLQVVASDPSDGQTSVSLVDNQMANKTMFVQLNAPIDAAGLTAFSLLENGTPRADIAVELPTSNASLIRIIVTSGLVAGAAYALVIDDTLTDRLGGPHAVETISFTAAP